MQRGRVGDLGRRAEDTCRGCVAQGLDVAGVWLMTYNETINLRWRLRRDQTSLRLHPEPVTLHRPRRGHNEYRGRL